MCGRLNVTDSPTIQWISTYLGIDFSITPNVDLRPTQLVSAITHRDGCLRQIDVSWGIKPTWSKKVLINARSETVGTARTFKDAFGQRRCIVPCAGWYEWRDEGGSRKQKYSFTRADGIPFLMAGIWFEGNDVPQLVTLTTYPNKCCAKIHNRMPVLIQPDKINTWLNASEKEVRPLLEPIGSGLMCVAKCD